MILFRPALAPLLAFLLAAPVTAAPALWRFGDADTTIYLFGTIHALPPGYQWQDARIRKALSTSDTLVVETLIDKDPQAIARLFPPPDASLPPIIERVPPKLRPRFLQQINRAGITQASLDRMPTWQAAFIMMGATIKKLGIQRDAGVEANITPAFEPAAITATAPAARIRKVEALETASAQLELFATLPEADQRELLAAMVDSQSAARTDYSNLLSDWTNGNQIAIAKAFEKDEDLTPHLREVLLRRRNAAWTEWLKKRLDVPGTVFVAVGAGHLAGPLSVRAMLAAEGITVRRVYNNAALNRATAGR
ncbi:polysaccharide biosynthesis protein GumN [Sphingomonas sp. SRS2]|nr:polysaccharide biosynthesis protein GumN [Sphingomonas sp. SRS2]